MIRWRINFILVFLFLFGAVIVGQLFYIQIIKGDFYRALAQGFYSSDRQTLAERGRVFFRSGEPLAVNIDWPIVFSSPLEIEEKESTAKELARILSLEEDFILEKLKKENLYEPIKRRPSEEEIQKIKELNLKGVYLGRERRRYYPQETIASQLIGFLDFDSQGQYGIEGHYNEILQGKRNQPGQDIFLTIDYPVQFMAEKLLEQAEENLNIEEGEIIVMDPNSGEILALANFPSFNPNQYSEVSDFTIFKNSATQKIFEPGSVFKPITVIAGLEEEKITPQTTYFDTGFVQIGGHTIRNYGRRVWGEQTMTEVLEKSINTGAVFVEEKIGHNSFLEYLDAFGFFKPTGIDLPEVYSENRHFKRGYEVNFATASFGQGIEMTSIQLIGAFSAIANGGNLIRPYLVREIVDFQQNLEGGFSFSEKQTLTGSGNSIVSTKAAAQLTAMMVSVTENGFAKSARVPGYYVAGKTGTAQIAWSALGVNQRGYSEETWQSFAGFAPAFNPEFVILVKLKNPQARTAEYSAAPIFREMAKYLLDYYQIPPDYDISG